jgi:two-component system response regulator NreC
MLEGQSDLELVDEAAEARVGFALIDACKPDVVAMDVSLPGMNGIAATRELRWRASGSRVLLLGSGIRERDVLEGLAAGATGFALKCDVVETILCALRTVGRPALYLPPTLRGVAVAVSGPARRRLSLRADDVLAPLSARERDVMDLVVRGWPNREIARELCVSVKTVDTHRSRINRKLSCRNAGDIIRFAADNGLLPDLTHEPRPVARVESPMHDASPAP